MPRLSAFGLTLLCLLGGAHVVDDFPCANATSARDASVVVILPVKAAFRQQGEATLARETAQTINELFQELGIGAETVDEHAVAGGALGPCRVAILPYNPAPSTDAAEALARFVESGGKLLACYQLPPRLGGALGFAGAKYVRQRRPGQFAEMRFDAADVPGLPRSVRQRSWNIIVAEPTDHNAQSRRSLVRRCRRRDRISGRAVERSRRVSQSHRAA